MTSLHIIAAIIAAFRFTEFMTVDAGPWAIFARARQLRKGDKPRFGVLSCVRCASPWAAGLALILWHWLPFANWPFGISYIYLIIAMLSSALNRLTSAKERKTRGRELLLSIENNVLNVVHSDFSVKDIEQTAAWMIQQAHTPRG